MISLAIHQTSLYQAGKKSTRDCTPSCQASDKFSRLHPEDRDRISKAVRRLYIDAGYVLTEILSTGGASKRSRRWWPSSAGAMTSGVNVRSPLS